MPFSNPHIDWIHDDLASLTLDTSMSWTDQITAIEALSETNLSGRPINYLIELKGQVCFCHGPDAENLAEIFLHSIPARTALALLRPVDQPPGDCEAEFHVRLSAAGYRIGNFDTRPAALAWLDQNPTPCAVRDLHCGPDCPEAYSSACPAIASRQPAISHRQEVGPGARPAMPGISGRPTA